MRKSDFRLPLLVILAAACFLFTSCRKPSPEKASTGTRDQEQQDSDRTKPPDQSKPDTLTGQDRADEKTSGLPGGDKSGVGAKGSSGQKSHPSTARTDGAAKSSPTTKASAHMLTRKRPYLLSTYPFMPEAIDANVHRKNAAWILNRTEADVIRSLDPEAREKEANQKALSAVDDLMLLHARTGESRTKTLALGVLRTLNQRTIAASDEELRRQVTKRGAFDRSNLRMRDAALDLARIYHLSGDGEAARKSALIMAKLAEAMPEWPLVRSNGTEVDQDDRKTRMAWDANGLWGNWIWSDLEEGLPVVRAYDLIYDSGVMQEMGVQGLIEKQLIRYIPDHFLERPMTLSNLIHYVLRALPLYGLAIEEPEYIHQTVRLYRYTMQSQFYADGFWHEGSPAYHKDLIVGLTEEVPPILKGYSDPRGYVNPKDGVRFDNLDLAREFRRQHDRMWEALKKLTFPDREYAKLHDARYPHEAWWDDTPSKSVPKLLGSMGHAVLGTHAGRNQAQVHLHFSGTHGHEHYDALSMILFAQGKELVSETTYNVPDGWESTQEWQMMTAAHNTVVVDEKDQEDRFPDRSHTRPITEKDAMSGIPDWRYRDSGQGNTLNDPRLRCFFPEWDPVQVVEVSGERAYHPDPDMYRRTLALVQINGTSVYAVDIFRVSGGRIHDWMLHGALELPYDLSISVPQAGAPGTLHTYLKSLRSGRTDAGWSALFSYGDGTKLGLHMAGAPGTEIILGKGPAMRRKGFADFLDVRRSGGKSVFASVLDPFTGNPDVLSVESFPFGKEFDMGLTIKLRDGTEDIILSASGDPPYQETVTSDGIVFRGRFAHLRYRSGRIVHAFAVDAEHLKAGEIDLTGPGYYEGVIKKTYRVEAGDAYDAFETAAQIPPGQENRYLALDLGSTLTQTVQIERVESRSGGSLIRVKDEPGMEILNDLIRMKYYPGWTIDEPCRFHIAGKLLWKREN